MKALLTVLILAAILFHVAGQIYLVAFAIKKARQTNIFFRIVIGIFFFLFVNIPGLTASALLSETKMLPDQTAVHTLPWFFLSIIVSSWSLGISCFGFIQFIRDYWLLYKRKRAV